MSWRTAAVVLTVIMAVVVLQAALADPLISVGDQLNDTGDYSNDAYDGNALITSLSKSWINMGTVLIFGIMAYGVATVIKRELTRGGL